MKSLELKTTSDKRTVVIGIDGATFDVIDPLVAAGRLPHLAYLMSHGSRARLLSTIPPLSPVAWTSLATGMQPGKHGIIDFLQRRADSYEVELANALSRGATPIWQQLSLAGRTVGVINVPMTYPPDRVNGFMISGMDSPRQNSELMHPASLVEELRREIGGYRLEDMDFRSMGGRPDRLVKGLYEILDNRFAVSRYLIERYPTDFFFTVFEAVDRAQHNFWKNPAGGGETGIPGDYSGVVEEVYQKVDQKVGVLLKQFGPQDNIFIVSDHGFASIRKGVRVNLWLAGRGYQTLRPPLPFYRRAHREIGNLAKRAIKSVLPEGAVSVLRRDRRNTRPGSGSFNVLPNVDMRTTQAFAISSYGIYLNVRGREPLGTVEPGKHYESLRETLISELLALEDPATGERVIKEAFRREEVMTGNLAHWAPDIYILWNDGYFFMGERQKALLNIKTTDREVFVPHNWAGQHHREGVLIMKGPFIKAGRTLPNANIIDVAPTLMYLMGLEIPREMDGMVLEAAIESSYLRSVPPCYKDYEGSAPNEPAEGESYSEEEAAAVRARLRDLGYLD